MRDSKGRFQIKDRTGEKLIMKCGLELEIIEYRRSNDIDVQFEDGIVLTGVRYESFKNRNIKHPDYDVIRGISRNEYFLSTVLEPYGFKKAKRFSLKSLGLGSLELDLYNPDFNGYKIAIEYDGFYDEKKEIGHSTKNDLKKDAICKNADIILIRIREAKLPKLNSSSINFICKSGIMLSDYLIETINEVIDYLNSNYSGNIKKVENVDKDKILMEYLEFYNRLYLERINKSRIMNCGYEGKIVVYRNASDIDVEFEDGEIAYHKSFDKFLKGNIAHPKGKRKVHERYKDRFNEYQIMNCGDGATIIAYRGAKDIDVMFDDGEIVTGVAYSKFKSGSIAHPTKKRKSPKKMSSRLNEIKMMDCGYECKIVEYRNANDIDVQFVNDGKIAYHKKYSRFCKGLILHPDLEMTPEKIKELRLNEIPREMNCGKLAKIIEYINSKNMTIQFIEDEEIVEGVAYNNFVKGEVKHPIYGRKRRK